MIADILINSSRDKIIYESPLPEYFRCEGFYDIKVKISFMIGDTQILTDGFYFYDT